MNDFDELYWNLYDEIIDNNKVFYEKEYSFNR